LEVDQLSETERGESGFGSTDAKQQVVVDFFVFAAF
jgi:hypothetical protein